jgi:hypothetical protein
MANFYSIVTYGRKGRPAVNSQAMDSAVDVGSMS